jgi:hypothetical protein
LSWSITATLAGTSAALAGRGPLTIAVALLLIAALLPTVSRAVSRSLTRAPES